LGCALGPGFARYFEARDRTGGTAQTFYLELPAGRNPASHQAAKPERASPNKVQAAWKRSVPGAIATGFVSVRYLDWFFDSYRSTRYRDVVLTPILRRSNGWSFGQSFLSLHVPASPPDVRRGWAPPVSSKLFVWAAPLVRALPGILRPETERGAQPKLFT